MPDFFELQIDGHVATLTITSKTMPPAFFAGLADACAEIDAASDVRVAILRASHPKAFSYGLDLPAAFKAWAPMLQGSSLAKGRRQLLHEVRRLQRYVDALAELRVPTIAAVHGWCLGGGVDVIAACDIRLCSADAKFGVRETQVAIVADLGSLQRLPPIIGQGRTRELAFTGRDFDAAYADKIGLVNAVHPDREALDAAARALADEIAANSPLAVEGAKDVLNQGVARQIREGLDYVGVWNSAFLPSKDLGEAASAFVMRRPAKFQGE